MRLVPVLPLFLLAACGAGAGPVADVRPAPADPSHAIAPPVAVREAPRGFEERVQGVRVLHLFGTPEQMGEQMGRMCGDDLRYLVDANLKQIPWIRRDPKAAVEKAKRFAAGIPDDQMRELRATAAAARVDEDWLLVAACVIEVVDRMRACAAVAAWGTATPSGDVIVGRNLDWFDFGKLHEHGLIVVRHPESGHAYVSCGFPGVPGVLTGMNDAGVFTADLVQFAKHPPEPSERGIPVMSLQRLALERCASAADAAKAIEDAARTVPQNYIVADADGAIFLETDSAKVGRRAPLCDTVAGTNWAEEARGTLKGDLRFGNLCACLDPKVGALGVPEIEAALAAASSDRMSIMSVVAMPARRALRISTGTVPACKGPFADVDAGALMRTAAR